MQYSRYNKGLLFFPEVIFQCSSIKSISLEENYIREINEEIGLLANLEDLILYDNLICEIPSSICRTKLKYLDISNNVLKNINIDLFNIITIQYLDFSHNELTCIPMEISKLIFLRHLDISNNDLSCIPDSIALLSLEFLDISNNNIIALPTNLIANLPKLKELYILHNKLSDIYSDFIVILNKIIIGLDITSYNIINNFYYGKNIIITTDINNELNEDITLMTTTSKSTIIECPFLEIAFILKPIIKTWFPCSITYINEM